MIKAHLIEKEAVDSLSFPHEEVNLSVSDQKQLKQQLKKAVTLGNLERFKVHIIFEDDTDTKEIYTTVWAITEKKIILKAGRSIPLRRVCAIRFV